MYVLLLAAKETTRTGDDDGACLDNIVEKDLEQVDVYLSHSGTVRLDGNGSPLALKSLRPVHGSFLSCVNLQFALVSTIIKIYD